MRTGIFPGILIATLLLIPGCSRHPEQVQGKVTVTFWHSFVASTIPSLENLLRDFELSHPAIHIQAQYIPTGDGLIQKLVSAIQSKTTPDVSWIHADFLDKLVESGSLVPLKQFLEGPDSLPAEDLRDIFPALLEAGMYRGELFSMPMEATSLALFYNRGLFRSAGLDPDRPPQTWEELEHYALRLTSPPDAEGRRDRYGFFVPVFPASGELNIWMILQWTPFLWQAGGDEFSPDRFEVRFDSPAGIKAVSFWKRIYKAEDFSRFGIAHDLGFASGKLAMVLDGPWNLPRYRAMKGVDWRVAPLPAGPEGHATYIAGEQLAIFRQSAHQAEAWTFVKWMVGKEVQARFSMESGYLPVRRSVLAMKNYRDFLETDPTLKAFVMQMDAGRGRQNIDRHRVEINRFLAEAIERAILGDEDPQQCLKRAAAQANGLLKGGNAE
jgi:ABC-type glycerol-3-phosphate transport system substrate-binding protein